ncbi:MAG: ABC transporter ATP-binding protein [Nanoarchaeota archaeon]|nr:ABC transporter ATP-binding protein [Nanoarchaeota archaeon]MBU1644244.1 ABC transporter ATP-binding protein [Nanoarchaeota archaeon]MBU1977236.1 ABC transporter ATP-binding protein [Nanoarchaeota archaeon]
MKLIELKGVRKRFKNDLVLDDVNLVIEEGDILGVIGYSGSGKTTLLNMISGFIEPSEGEVLYTSKITEEPININKKLHKVKELIGFAPQHSSFYPKLTVVENLLHFGQLYGLKRETTVNNIKALLQATNLHSHRNKLSEHLSGGMQKRLDISCSLVHKPKILILDEPIDDLDYKLQKEILYFLQQINQQGVTLVIASHHLNMLETICTKIAIIHDGTVKSHGLLEDVKKPFLKEHFSINLTLESDKEKILSMLSRFPAKKIIDQGNNIIVHPSDTIRSIGNILQIIEEEKLYLHDMDFRKPTLNEIFEAITQEEVKKKE